MWQRQTEPDDRQHLEAPEQRNRRALTIFLLLCSLVLRLASASPPVLIAPVLSQLFAYASFGVALAAAFGRDPAFAGHLTRWDQAAAFMALSLLAGLFVDTAAVADFLDSFAPGGLQEMLPVSEGAAATSAT